MGVHRESDYRLVTQGGQRKCLMDAAERGSRGRTMGLSSQSNRQRVPDTLAAQTTGVQFSPWPGPRGAFQSPRPRAGVSDVQHTLGNRRLAVALQRCANGRPCAACAAAGSARREDDLGPSRRRAGSVQRLTIGAADDPYEREADRVAERVMRMPVAAVQRKCASCEEEETRLHRRPHSPSVARTAASDSSSGDPVPAIVHQAIASEDGRPLDTTARAFFEPRFGADFSDVRVHADASAAGASKAVSARAFTLGRGIYFAAGEYRPHAEEGRRLLAHELTHVAQQQRDLASAMPMRRAVAAGNVDCNPPAAPDIPVVGADPLTRLRAADRRAIELLSTAHDSLEFTRNRILAGEPPAWPTVSDRVAEGLRRLLRLNPDNAAVWTGVGPGSVFVVMRRFEIVRNLLRSGTIHYHCRSSPAGACSPACGGPCCPGIRRSASCFGVFDNFLCDLFWTGEGPAGRALAVMHEPFHMSFSFAGDTGRLGNAHCYVRLAFWITGVDVPAVPDWRGPCPLAP